jgi:pyroglutamyl-peptidase
MATTVLLTSFQPWLPHQKTNSSDDLIEALLSTRTVFPGLHTLRHLPVHFHHAPLKTIAQVNHLRPNVLLCCGMSEKSTTLQLESRAIAHREVLHTPVNLAELADGLSMTQISHDAGRFVCNYLYYVMLRYIQDQRLDLPCLFVHVPVLTPENRWHILNDFQKILHRVYHPHRVDFPGESGYQQSLDPLSSHPYVDVVCDSHAS